MEVEFKNGYQIEVGLTQKDVEKLWFGGMIEERGILTGAEKFILIASKEIRDRMIRGDERIDAEIKYNPKDSPPYTSEENFKIIVEQRKERDKVFAKYIGNGDVEVYMSEETVWRIHPDGITEIKLIMPQILRYHPNNYVTIVTKIPF